MKKCILGIDTSNYMSSLSLVSLEEDVIYDERILLKVKKGERGLRQSEAVFYHIENLPVLFDKLSKLDFKLVAVAVSSRPRPIIGSYMPCFKAGYGFGKAISDIMKIPFYEFSHQEGHIEAIKYNSKILEKKPYLAWHLSGGTCELLKVNHIACNFADNHEETDIQIIGGSKDISFGQVIDRIGVLLGLDFPAGKYMDARACETYSDIDKYSKRLTKIKTDGLYFNLSGIETQGSRLIEQIKKEEYNLLIVELFDNMADTIINITEKASIENHINDVIFAGGVSSSKYIRKKINEAFSNSHLNIHFGLQELSGDNAVGVALLGGKAYGYETR